MFLQDFPPMGVYETLFKFQDATGRYIGDPGTHPWAQGFPLTTQLPGGLTADELNTRLFRHNAAILHGTMGDMRRRGRPQALPAFFVRAAGAGVLRRQHGDPRGLPALTVH